MRTFILTLLVLLTGCRTLAIRAVVPDPMGVGKPQVVMLYTNGCKSVGFETSACTVCQDRTITCRSLTQRTVWVWEPVETPVANFEEK